MRKAQMKMGKLSLEMQENFEKRHMVSIETSSSNRLGQGMSYQIVSR